MSQPQLRTVEVKLQLVSGQDNFNLAELVESTLKNGPLNNSEFRLEVLEVKVVKSEDIKDEHNKTSI